MEVEDRTRPRSTLPPLGSLRMDRTHEEEIQQHPKYPSISSINMPGTQLPSPAATHSGPPSYYHSSSTGSASGTGYISPPDSRRTTKDEGDQSAGRQSLPSIKEALSNNPLPYQGPAHPPPPPPEPAAPLSVAPGPAPPPRPSLGGPQGPPNPFAQPASASSVREPAMAQPPPLYQSQQQQETQRAGSFSAVNGADSRSRAAEPYGPPRSPRTAVSSNFIGAPNQSPVIGNGFGSNPATSPTSYGSFRSSFSHNIPPSHPPPALPPSEEAGRPFSSNWKFDSPQKYPPPIAPGQGHTDSVKRHLDIYESEMAFNDVLEGSGRILDFSKVYAARLHQNQRSEFPLDALPPLAEIEDMMKHAHRLHVGLERIRTSVIFQQQALVDERNRAYHSKVFPDEANGYHDEYKGAFATSDAKKRRGKAAPPGRCHSCNRAETPEWRRGPDGARTLCNACGLHYAKLTRKNGANKSIGSSNLRPKND